MRLIDRLSKQLIAAAKARGVYSNPTARGDGREDLVRDILAERIGSSFAIHKAEVVDSLDRSTGEFDAVIYDQLSTSRQHVMGQRRIVRIEALALTLEVKSVVDAAQIETTSQRLTSGLLKLRRFYAPTHALTGLAAVMNTQQRKIDAPEDVKEFNESLAAFGEGIPALENHADVPTVVNAVFAYDGPARNKAEEFLARPYIDIVCVLTKYTLAKADLGFKTSSPKDVVLWGKNSDAFGAFLHLVEGALQRLSDARYWVRPKFENYFSPKVVRRAPNPVTNPGL